MYVPVCACVRVRVCVCAALTPLPLGEVGVCGGVVEVPAEHGLSTRVEVIGKDQRCGGVRGHFRRSEHKANQAM